jgi:hypothetical protein
LHDDVALNGSTYTSNITGCNYVGQFVSSLFEYSTKQTKSITYIPASGIGFVFVLQVFFSQGTSVKTLFNTQPLSFLQALFWIGIGFLVVMSAMFLKRFVAII